MPASEIPMWISEWRPHTSWTQQKRISHEHQSLIFAEIEHRAWVRNINDYLEDKKDCPPALAVDNCRFAQWQNNEGKIFYSDNDAFTCIKELHNKVHSLGSNICGQHRSGKHEEATKSMAELYVLQDALIANLGKLM
ncbi:CZB domain-containing protein [Sedimenticola selenatireducens]|uniref:CZB domain-containing protein n=1 Tax=Sedimenticola selenatireducens TaxID=191960 RepID=UPI0009FCE288|nr:CZB domain-containing protein [Sedimenticola selenatireducens]